MAENVVDKLSIEISADAQKAVKSLGLLETRLLRLVNVTRGMKNSIMTINALTIALDGLSRVSLGNLTKTTNSLKKLNDLKLNNAQNITNISSALHNLGSVNVKDNGVSSFVNSIKRLSEVKINSDTATHLTNIAQSLNSFAKTKDISSSVNNLIVALAKLASASRSMWTVSAELPNFGAAIRKVATVLSQLGGVNPQITQFVRSLAQLANAGDKMLVSAQNLGVFGNAIRQLIATLNGANINQDVAKLVSAISELSTSMAQLGKGGAPNAVTSNTNKMSNAFRTFEKVVRKVTSVVLNLFKKMARGIASAAKEIITRISGMKSATNSMFTVADGIKSVIGGLLGMRGITGAFNWLKEAVTAGGDITEINHIVESVFEKDMVDSVNTWAKNAISQFGIAEGAAKHYAGVLSSMFQASGIARRTAGEMSMDLVGIASDLSAFYNIDTETAYQKIKSGMAGMVRPLRKQHCAFVQKCA